LTWVDQAGLTGAGSPFVSAALRAALVLPIAFALAALSRRFLELPALRWKAVLAP
jgi:peptidoglycan/LPS O-acetylase OafA/YrhL